MREQIIIQVLGHKAFDIGRQMPPRTAARYSSQA